MTAIREVRSLLAAYVDRETDPGLRRNALDIRDALLKTDTQAKRNALMEFVTAWGHRVALKDNQQGGLTND